MCCLSIGPPGFDPCMLHMLIYPSRLLSPRCLAAWTSAHNVTIFLKAPRRRAFSMAKPHPHGYAPRWASGEPFDLPLPSKVVNLIAYLEINLIAYLELNSLAYLKVNLAAYLKVNLILCVAKNFASSKEELDSHRENLNESMDKAIIFSKSLTSLVPITQPIELQQREDVFYETELALLITEQLPQSPSGCPPKDCLAAVGGVAVALDLTLKDVQNSSKAAGGSWEKAKAFDRSCPISDWVKVAGLEENSEWKISTKIDDHLVQEQSTTDMLIPLHCLLAQLTKSFTLLPGDIVLTGTPVLPRRPRPTQAWHAAHAERRAPYRNPHHLEPPHDGYSI
ncbi:Fumarylacetoacetate hydrolase domain-containing protein 2A [Perkinsus olseni]|uniref:Fumarylacetoacetate hydrolase domain-containing protein 2A n=1 Tax=Perkinsus olseni TaxID=32597 RepID=A0A7J6PEV0_PEROL|nr:Fumarylacetoacetate hydrolase domain-containing protein 2A [Perkinsus olseni]